MNTRAKAARSMFWSLAENIGLALISLLCLMLYTRLLNAEDFGLFSVALAANEILAIIVSMLFHDALVQRPSITQKHYDTAFCATIALSLILTVACWLFAPAFAWVMNRPDAAPLQIWLALSLPCTAFSAIITARQRRDLEFRLLAIRSLSGRVIGAIVGVLAALIGWGIWSLVIQQVAMAAVGALVLWLFATNRPHFRFGRQELKDLLGFALISSSRLFVLYSYKRLYVILAGAYLGSVAAGYLNLSFRVVDMFAVIASTAVSQIALPVLSRVQADPAKLKKAYGLAQAFACAGLYPLFIGLGVCAPEVIEILFGAKWLPSSPFVMALAFLMLVQGPRLLSFPLLTAIGRPQHPLYLQSAILVFMVAAMVLTHTPSLVWAVAIWAICETVSYPFQVWLLYRSAGLTVGEQFRGVVAPFLASVILAASVEIARQTMTTDLNAAVRLAIFVPVGAVAYLVSIYVIDRRMVRELLEFVTMVLHRQPKRGA